MHSTDGLLDFVINLSKFLALPMNISQIIFKKNTSSYLHHRVGL